MAFPNVRSSRLTTITSNSTSWTVTFPYQAADIKDGGSDYVLSGDLILVCIGRDGSSGTGAISGFSTLFDQATGTAARGLTFAKVATGSETDLTYTPGANEQGVARIIVIKDWYGAISGGVEANGTGNTGTDNAPDPPSLTPSWGAADNRWLACAAHDNGTRVIDGYPTNYDDNPNADTSGGGTGAGLGTASRNLNGSPEDPGTFSLSAADDWVSWVVAIRPSSKVQIAGRTRVIERLKGTALTTTVALRTPKTRIIERLKGFLGFQPVTTFIQSVTRTSQRLLAELHQHVYPTGILRTAQRLTGILATTVALSGQVRAAERLTGAVETTVAVAGTTRTIERNTGDLGFQDTSVALAGTVRTSARLIGRGRQVAPGGMHSGLVRWRATASTTGNVNITGFGNGSRPIKALLFINPGGSTANTINNTNLQGSCGMSDGTTNICFAEYEQNTVTTTNTARGWRSDTCYGLISSTAWDAGRLTWDGTTVTDGVTLNYDAAFTLTHDTLIVAFWDCDAEVATPSMPTTATSEVQIPHTKTTYDLAFLMQVAQGGSSPQLATTHKTISLGFFTQLGQGVLTHGSDDNQPNTVTWTAFDDSYCVGRSGISDSSVRRIRGIGLYDGTFMVEKQDTTGIDEKIGILLLRGANPRVGVFNARTDTTPFNIAPSGIGTIHGAMFWNGNQARTGSVEVAGEDGGIGVWCPHPSTGADGGTGEQQMYRGEEQANNLATSDTVRLGAGYWPSSDNHGILLRNTPGTGTQVTHALVTAHPGPTLEITYDDPDASTTPEVLWVAWGQSTPPLTAVTATSQRLTGALTFAAGTTAVAGKLRTSQRLTGALISTVDVAGTLRTSQRLTGLLTTTVDVAGTVRTSQRLTGAVETKAALAGISRFTGTRVCRPDTEPAFIGTPSKVSQAGPTDSAVVTHTVPGGYSNMALVVLVNEFDITHDVTSVTWFGQTFSKYIDYDNGVQLAHGEVWYLLNPVPGTGPITVNRVAGSSQRLTVIASALKEVNLSTIIAATHVKSINTGVSHTTHSDSMAPASLPAMLLGHSFMRNSSTVTGDQGAYESQDENTATLYMAQVAKVPDGASKTFSWSFASTSTATLQIIMELPAARVPPLTTSVAIASTERTSQRLTGVLTSTVDVAGTLRTSQRLTGDLTFVSSNVQVAGKLRTSQRLTGVLTTTVDVAGTLRTSERLTGVLTTTVDVAGTVRTSERLIGLVSTNLQLAGKVRTSQRLTGAVISTVDIAGTTRTSQRLTGLLTTTVDTAGTVRHTQRLTGVLLTKSALEGTVRTSERLIGAVITTVDITGTVRTSERLTGALTSTVSAAGKLRHSQRLTGNLTMMSSNQPIAGKLATSQRLRGVLITTVDIAGKVRTSQRLTGILLKEIGSAEVRGSSGRLLGQLLTRQAVAGKLRHSQRLTGDLQASLGAAKTVTVDAVLKKTDITKTVTVDAVLQKAFTKTVTVDAVLKKALTKAVAADAVLKKLDLTKTTTVDAVLQKAFTKSVTVDAYLIKNITKSVVVDAVLQKALTKTVTVDAVLQKALTKSVSVDAVLQKTETKSVTVDAVLQKALTQTVVVDAVLKKIDITKTVTVDAHIIRRTPLGVTVDALLKKNVGLAVTVDAVLLGGIGNIRVTAVELYGPTTGVGLYGPRHDPGLYSWTSTEDLA